MAANVVHPLYADHNCPLLHNRQLGGVSGSSNPAEEKEGGGEEGPRVRGGGEKYQESGMRVGKGEKGVLNRLSKERYHCEVRGL